MAAAEPDRFVTVDATADITSVEWSIRRAIGRLPGLGAIGPVPIGAGADEPEAPVLRMTR